jgi:hypothetical protein
MAFDKTLEFQFLISCSLMQKKLTKNHVVRLDGIHTSWDICTNSCLDPTLPYFTLGLSWLECQI